MYFVWNDTVLTRLCYITHWHALFMSHETQHTEDNKPREQTSTAVSTGKRYGISENKQHCVVKHKSNIEYFQVDEANLENSYYKYTKWEHNKIKSTIHEDIIERTCTTN